MDLASVVALYFCFVRGTCSLLRWQILGTSHCAVRCLLYFPILHCYAFTFYSSNFDMYMSYGWGSTGENVTSERHTTWRQSVTRCDVRALHNVTSGMSHDVTSERYMTWRQICPTKDKILLHGSFMRMRILPRAYRSTITRIRFHASGYFSSSAIPLCASGHVSFVIW